MTWEEAVLWLRAQPAQAELVRACFYDDPLPAAAERYYRSSEWRGVRRLLPPAGGKALDVGAGRGISAYALARDGWQTTAVEPDASGVVGAGAIRQLARETGVVIQVVEQTGESLPFPDQTFDLTHCRAVMHHARDLGQLCREMTRVLRPGGVLVATREHVISRRQDLSRFLAAHPLHRLYGGENAYLLSDYLGAIRGAGLELKRVLNPYESDVNLFPETMESMKSRLVSRIGLPWPRLIPDVALAWLGERSDQPGRHYSFVAVKARHG
jgi:SAM-dependent methyltransferase